MGSPLEILGKLNRIDVNLSAAVAIEETASSAASEQRAQLNQGLRSDNTYMPEYSFRSVFQFGKPPGPIRLYDQGDFYRGILVDVRGDIFLIESADSKSTMLQNRYGREILGLGSQAKINYIRVLKPEFIRQIKNYLQ